jgi:RNA polymerase sigma-70 factor (ECF subfamily)
VSREAVFEPLYAEQPGLEEVLTAEHSSPSQRCRRNEDEQRLYQALARLPERQQIAVRMKHLQGRTLAEIGEILGCNADAAAAVVARGIRSLQANLG